MVKIGAQRHQQGPASLEHGRLAPDEKDELAAPRFDRAAAHGRVETFDAGFLGRRRHLAPAIRIDGAQVDQGHAGADGLERAILVEIGATDGRGIGQARQDEVRGFRDSGRRRGQDHPVRLGLSGTDRVHVVARHLVPLGHESTRHLPAHAGGAADAGSSQERTEQRPRRLSGCSALTARSRDNARASKAARCRRPEPGGADRRSRRRLNFVDGEGVGARNAKQRALHADAIRIGQGIFRSRCADCHGMDARGMRAPDLTQVWASGRTDDGLYSTLRNGVAGTEQGAAS